METLVVDLKKALDDVNSCLADSSVTNREWTHQIKQALTKLGHSKRYLVYASEVVDADGGEWLYDLSWLEYDGDEIIKIGLAVESEWLKPRDVLEDFQKLCQSRAEFRLMVFQAKNDEERELITASLKKQIAKFRRGEVFDEYLLSCWVQSGRAFHHEYLQTAA